MAKTIVFKEEFHTKQFPDNLFRRSRKRKAYASGTTRLREILTSKSYVYLVHNVFNIFTDVVELAFGLY